MGLRSVEEIGVRLKSLVGVLVSDLDSFPPGDEGDACLPQVEVAFGEILDALDDCTGYLVRSWTVKFPLGVGESLMEVVLVRTPR